ncbi:SsrA-binding protein SmpB [Nannocystis punicea]|uniref:SsrA-binding protein n=1 Tax=Nannocystis punicea TaxID=2995304 RepID=A0ABY7HG16_9BACT|nr:SsrA-binding protein SmpB [Nannocystis poenicansa]WAS98248.1 SsrA-binding protein SmpB [Nannocystis poenicansa]
MKKIDKTATKDGHLFVQNRRATFEYEVLERYEAGLALMGSEVKSIRDGRASLGESYCQFQGDQLYLYQSHIGEYTQAHDRNHLPLRPRKLLLHRKELDHLAESVDQAGLTLIPLALLARNGRIKLELALCRGKKTYDKRASIKEREQKREIDRAMRERT